MAFASWNWRSTELLDEEVENLLRLVDGDEVPPEFRQRVEEYYRSLANRREPD